MLLTAVRGPPRGRRQRRRALRLPQPLGAWVGQRRGPHLLDGIVKLLTLLPSP